MDGLQGEIALRILPELCPLGPSSAARDMASALSDVVRCPEFRWRQRLTGRPGLKIFDAEPQGDP